MSQEKVTIIMRSKNSNWVISQSLAALYSQDNVDFELIIVDSGSTDGTLETIKSFPHQLIKISPTDYYPGSVLNMAIEKARTNLIVFLNSDTVPLQNDALLKLIEPFEDKNIHATYARQIPRPEAETWVKDDYQKSFPDSGQKPDWITLSLPFAAMRKETWKQHNFYTDAWASEDTEWGQWAKENQLVVKYVKDSRVMHSHNYTLKQLFGRKYVEGEADAFIFDQQASLLHTFISIFKSIAKGFLLHLKHFDLTGLLKSPIQNIVKEWAHYEGLRYGNKRKLHKDKNPSHGLVTILEYYNDGQKPEN